MDLSAKARDPQSYVTPAEPPVQPMPNWRQGHTPERSARAAQARRTSGRRRFVDPTTTDRDYSGAEVEFMKAMEEYKRSSGRMFPTWSEILEVLEGLGYAKFADSNSTFANG